MNADKTQLMWIGTRQQFANIDNSEYILIVCHPFRPYYIRPWRPCLVVS
jgi:hypothetical protein